MPAESFLKRTIAFIDGQNLYYSVHESFGYTYPNYHVVALSRFISQAKGRDFIQVRLYTGVPDKSDDPFWNHFWTYKMAMLGLQLPFLLSWRLIYPLLR